MDDLFYGIFNLIRQCAVWVGQIITKLDASAYIIAAFTAYSVVRFIILPAMQKSAAGKSDGVKKKEEKDD